MDRKTVLVGIAALLFAVGLIAGTTSVSSASTDCGSVLLGGGNAESSDLGGRIVGGVEGSPAQVACRASKGDRKLLVFGAFGLAIMTSVVAVAIKDGPTAQANG